MNQERPRAFILSQYPLLGLGILSLVLLLGSWHLWTDLNSDAGFNLYTFWQISEGKILFRDLAYYHGPLSPLLCGFIFWIFGASIEVLAIFHAVLALLISWMLWKIFTKIFDQWTGWLTSVFFLLAFAYVQNNILAGFNFIIPYKPEAVHGTFLCISAFFFLWHWMQCGEKKYLMLMGLAHGCALLTSMEVAISLSVSMAAIAAVFGAYFKKFNFKSFCTYLLALAMPPLVCFIFLRFYFSSAQAGYFTLQALLFPIRHPGIAWLPFYRETSGFANPGENIAAILKYSLICAVIILFFVYLSHRNRAWGHWKQAITMAGLGGLIFVSVSLGSSYPAWGLYPKAIPVILLVFLGLAARDLGRAKRDNSHANEAIFLFIWLFFCFLLLQKIILNPRVNHYGFFLAMPATMAWIAFLSGYLPRFLRERGLDARQFRLYLSILIMGMAASHLYISLENYRQRTFYVGRGADGIAMWDPAINPEGKFMEMALRWIEENTPRDSTLVMLPEADIYNYLARRRRTIPFTLHPMEYMAVGEEGALEALKKDSPDYIGLIARNAAPYGLGTFGQNENYGKNIFHWVQENYTEVFRLGSLPTEGNGFCFYKKNPH